MSAAIVRRPAHTAAPEQLACDASSTKIDAEPVYTIAPRLSGPPPLRPPIRSPCPVAKLSKTMIPWTTSIAVLGFGAASIVRMNLLGTFPTMLVFPGMHGIGSCAGGMFTVLQNRLRVVAGIWVPL